jgi:hypothetical protein
MASGRSRTQTEHAAVRAMKIHRVHVRLEGTDQEKKCEEFLMKALICLRVIAVPLFS